MNPSLKQAIKFFSCRLLSNPIAYWHLIRKRDSYLYTTGWMRSVKERKPVDHDGTPIPWMNFSVVNLLKERLTADLELFEYGSGYSTCFYASKVKSVTSIEYNEQWLQIVKATLPDNASLIFKAQDVDGEYCRAIKSIDKQFDVVIVDGRDRVNCVKQSLSSLSERGVILLDDSHRKRYQTGIAFLKEHNFRALTIDGLKPNGKTNSSTTICYRDGNCLGI